MKKNIDRMSEKKWGVFSHYLYGRVNNKENILSYRKQTSWDECVREFDVKRLARMLNDMGAGYYFITIMQGTKYMIAPNATYDKITGYKSGDACSARDLPMELADELAKYDIDLYLYITGDGPYKDPQAGVAFGYSHPREETMISEEYVRKWASVLEEYAVRYGKKVKGWWVDGCYEWMGYTNDFLLIYKEAIEKGNPDAIVTFNNGDLGGFEPQYDAEDYTCGESCNFIKLPKEKFINGKLGHVLAGLGANPNPYSRWGCPGATTYDDNYMFDYIKAVTDVGCVVTVDVATFRDGGIDPVHYDVLKLAGDKLREYWNR